MKLTIDFETRSAVDLKKAGPWRYANDPSTQIICLSVKQDELPSRIWYPGWVVEKLHEPPGIHNQELQELLSRADIIEAHNMEFERAVWYYKMTEIGFQDLPLVKLRCSAAKTAYIALPRDLAKACQAVRVPVQKDAEGRKLMLKMCKPRHPRKDEKEQLAKIGCTYMGDNQFMTSENKPFYLWHDTPEELHRLMEYCRTDTDAEHALSAAVPELPEIEQQIWFMDQEINRRGVYVDMDNIPSIIDALQRHEVALTQEVKKLTKRDQNPIKSIKGGPTLKNWLWEKGHPVEDTTKQTISELADNTHLDPTVRRIIQIRQAIGKASVGKYKAMVARYNHGRCQGLFKYSGAGTHRWSGVAIQPQNFVRDSYKENDLEAVFEAFRYGDLGFIQTTWDDPFIAASKCLRGSIKAEKGKRFICADYSSIEDRGNAWCADEEETLRQYESGLDLYKVTAAATFGCSYEDIGDSSDERQIGKVQRLALGYQGGIGAFFSMAKNYGIKLADLVPLIAPTADWDNEVYHYWGAWRLASAYLTQKPDTMTMDEAICCDILKQRYRVSSAMIAASWKGYQDAAMLAVENPGSVIAYGKVSYKVWWDARGNHYLTCLLPSGRILYYAQPRIKYTQSELFVDKNGDPIESKGLRCMNAAQGKWWERFLYGGLLCENIVQAISRDILAEAMLRLEAAGYPVYLHVHDEALTELPYGHGSLTEFENIMAIVPAWAPGFPMKVKSWEGERFRK